jgi:hypothetical protein
MEQIVDLEGLKAKLLARIEVVDGPLETDCWIWTKGRNTKGYGELWWNRRRYLAHRASWIVHRGAIPRGGLICHHCDQPLCIRPDHLFVGTDWDNTQDMIAKGRYRNGYAQIRTERVLEVKRLLETGLSVAMIAYKVGVSYSIVHNIKIGVAWAWLQYRPSWRRI